MGGVTLQGTEQLVWSPAPFPELRQPYMSLDMATCPLEEDLPFSWDPLVWPARPRLNSDEGCPSHPGPHHWGQAAVCPSASVSQPSLRTWGSLQAQCLQEGNVELLFVLAVPLL